MGEVVDEDLDSALRSRYPPEERDRLCKACADVVRQSHHFQGEALGAAAAAEDEHLDWHKTVGEVISCLEDENSGCHLCSLVYWGGGARVLEDSEHVSRSSPLRLKITSTDQLSRTQKVYIDGGFRSSFDFRPYVGGGLDFGTLYATDEKSLIPEWYSQGARELIPSESYTAGDGSFKLVNFWLDQCLALHAQCRQTVGEKSLPKRLIRVSRSPPSISLVETADLGQEVEYVALSYCWGPREVTDTILTGEDTKRFRRGIPYCSLPKTLQDAIVVTLKLDYEYIWIDRLCIDQQSTADFLEEAAKMGRYYSQAAVNIAALDSKAASEGCFKQRHPLSSQPCIIECSNKTSLSVNSYHNLFLARPWHNEEGWDQSKPSTSPLTKRAWVMQEKLLSPRTIYYGRDGIYWECRQICASENIPKSQFTSDAVLPYPSKIRSNMKSQQCSSKDSFMEILGGHGSNHESDVFVVAWSNIVEHYTTCQMSDRDDRLTAILGLIDSISTRTGRKVHYGIWEDFLPDQLLWRRIDTKEDSTRLSQVAPSWSWCSISKPVRILSPTFGMSAMVFRPHFQARLCNPPPMSRLLPSANVAENGFYACEIIPELPLARATCTISEQDGGRAEFARYSLRLAPPATSARMSADVDLPPKSEVWLVAMTKSSGYRSHAGRRAGLVLRVRDPVTAVFERVGYFETDLSNGVSWPDSEPEEPGGCTSADTQASKIAKLHQIILI